MVYLDSITAREYPYVNDPPPEPQAPRDEYVVFPQASEDGTLRFEIKQVVVPTGALMPVEVPMPPRALDALMLAWLRYRIGASQQ